MAEPLSPERRAKIEAHLAFTVEEGMTIGDVYVRDLLAEVDRLRERDASIHEELRDKRTDLLNIRGILSPQPGTGTGVPFEVGQAAAPAVEWLADEVDRLRAAVPSWADLRDLLAARRYTAATDVELTNAVMALFTGETDHG